MVKVLAAAPQVVAVMPVALLQTDRLGVSAAMPAVLMPLAVVKAEALEMVTAYLIRELHASMANPLLSTGDSPRVTAGKKPLE